jgi:hypothetical protein
MNNKFKHLWDKRIISYKKVEATINKIVTLNFKYQLDINNLCLPLQHLNISYFTFFSIFPLKNAKSLITISLNPCVLSRYFTKEYYLYDPHVVTPDNLEEGAVLWSTYNDGDYQGKYLYDLKENFGINNGVSLIRKKQTECYIFCFGTSKTNVRFFYNVFSNVILLKYFADYFLSEGVDIIKIFSKNAIDIHQLKGKVFLSQKGITQECKLEYKNDLNLF